MEVDEDSSGTLSKRIRNAEVEGYHYIVVIGDREVESGMLSVRKRQEGSLSRRMMKMTAKDLKADFILRDRLFT